MRVAAGRAEGAAARAAERDARRGFERRRRDGFGPSALPPPAAVLSAQRSGELSDLTAALEALGTPMDGLPVEVASQLLPQLHGWFVCVVAPRTRCRGADLAAELAATLREALPATTRVGAPRCMWLLANAKLERTLLCRVNLKS